MKKNVFLRSTLRQPAKTVMLLLVTALITFAFVARAAEYLLVKQETARLSEYYRPIGTIQSQNTGDQLKSSEILSCLEDSPYVKTAEKVRFGSAVAEEIYNVDAEENSASTYLFGDVFFYGTLQHVTSTTVPMPNSANNEQQVIYRFYFIVDEVVAGYPEAIQEGDTVALTSSYTVATMASLGMGKTYTDLSPLVDELEPGGRYLLRGEYIKLLTLNHLRDGDHSGAFTFKPLSTLFMAGSSNTSNVKEGLWYFPVEPGESADFDDPRLAGVAEAIQLIDDNQHALYTVGSQDVGALAAAMQESSGPYLLEGRWPDSADDAEGRRVCVIHETLAAQRGLSVGDTLTLSLRDLSETLTSSLYRADLNRLGDIETSSPEEYEIIGIFNTLDRYSWARCESAIFIPASAYPESFLYGYTDYYRTFLPDIRFELTTPDVERQFMTEAQADLEKFGVQVVMTETGWENFQAAVKPMLRSSLFNAITFSIALMVTFCLLAFVYCRMHRKNIAIVRALGVPARQCVQEATLPLMLAGVLGIGSGSVMGWRFTQQNAVETLRSLKEFGTVDGVELPVFWLAALDVIIFVLLVLLAAGSVHLLAQMAVIPLLQGGAAVKQKGTIKPNRPNRKIPDRLVDSPPLPAAAELQFNLSDAPAPVQTIGASHVLRFVWRHIARAKLKSALSVLLAVVFTVGLAAIKFSIIDGKGRVNTLYETTTVKVDIVQTGGKDIFREMYSVDNFVNASVVNAIRDTGFVLDGYLAGSKSASTTLYDGKWVRGEQVSLSSGVTTATVRYFNDLSEYRSEAGTMWSISYHDGWDDSLFAQDWAALDSTTPDDAPALFPIVLPQELYEQYSIRPGDTIGVYCGSFRLCEVSGYYEGAVGIDRKTTPLLMPASAVETMAGSDMAYSAAHFILDPAQNRESNQFEGVVNNIINSTGNALALRAVVWDEELHTVVEPLEDSIALMELLYPVVLVLSLLVAAGIAILFVMTSSKEAAIMRVLGTSRLKSRVMLALQTACTSAAGLLIGVLGVLAYTGRTRPDLFANLAGASAFCAVLYLLAAIIGSAASASAVTGRNPLELLQVRE